MACKLGRGMDPQRTTIRVTLGAVLHWDRALRRAVPSQLGQKAAQPASFDVDRSLLLHTTVIPAHQLGRSLDRPVGEAAPQQPNNNCIFSTALKLLWRQMRDCNNAPGPAMRDWGKIRGACHAIAEFVLDEIWIV